MYEGKWDGCLSLVGCLPRLSFSFATYVNLIVSLSSYVHEFQEITISHSDAITLHVSSTRILHLQLLSLFIHFVTCKIAYNLNMNEKEEDVTKELNSNFWRLLTLPTETFFTLSSLDCFPCKFAMGYLVKRFPSNI